MKRTQRRVLTVGFIAGVIVLLFPPWLWNAYGGTFGNGKLFEEPWGIVYGLAWHPPQIVLGPEDVTCGNCIASHIGIPTDSSVSSGSAPADLFPFYWLWVAELFLITFITGMKFRKAGLHH